MIYLEFDEDLVKDIERITTIRFSENEKIEPRYLRPIITGLIDAYDYLECDYKDLIEEKTNLKKEENLK